MAKGTVKWDEENLKENEESRTATMKIDEPPTPFNFDYCDEENDAEDAPAAGPAPASHPSGEERPAPAEVSFAAQWQAAGMDEILSDPSNLRPSFEENEELTEAELEEKKRAFEAKRKGHYSMKEALSMKVGFEEEEEEEESKQEAGAPDEDELKRQEFAKKRKAFYQERDREAAERAKAMSAEQDEDED